MIAIDHRFSAWSAGDERSSSLQPAVKGMRIGARQPWCLSSSKFGDLPAGLETLLHATCSNANGSDFSR